MNKNQWYSLGFVFIIIGGFFLVMYWQFMVLEIFSMTIAFFILQLVSLGLGVGFIEMGRKSKK